MLTRDELKAAREQLAQARAQIEAVRLLYLNGAYIQGARLLNDVAGLLADEIAALDKAIGAAQP
jgi:hypothetical protein